MAVITWTGHPTVLTNLPTDPENIWVPYGVTNHLVTQDTNHVYAAMDPWAETANTDTLLCTELRSIVDGSALVLPPGRIFSGIEAKLIRFAADNGSIIHVRDLVVSMCWNGAIIGTSKNLANPSLAWPDTETEATYGAWDECWNLLADPDFAPGASSDNLMAGSFGFAIQVWTDPAGVPEGEWSASYLDRLRLAITYAEAEAGYRRRVITT